MTDPPCSTTTAPTPDGRWRRFTLLDALVLQAGFAAGFSLAGWAVWLPGKSLTVLTILFWGLVGVQCGAVFNGPLVLAVHYTLRGRREWLSRGELLWLVLSFVSIVSFLFTFIATGDWDMSFLAAYLVTLFCPLYLVVVMAAGREFHGIRLRKRTVPCRWTDGFGIVWACSLAAFDLVGVLYYVFHG